MSDMAYAYQYDENGGYDCMYSAYIVTDSNGRVVFEVDFRHHGQKACEWPPSAESFESAESLTRGVVAALNGKTPSPE